MAILAGEAPSTGWDALQTRAKDRVRSVLDALEIGLEAERAHLPLWIPIWLGLGIGGWFAMPRQSLWVACILAGLALALMGAALGWQRRLGMALIGAGAALALGCALAWQRAEHVAAPVLIRPQIVHVRGTIISAEPIAARAAWRLVVAPDDGLGLPRLVRLSVAEAALARAPPADSLIAVRARLTPPPEPILPDSFDFRRPAWFAGIGAVGKALDPPHIQLPKTPVLGLRDRLNARIAGHLPEAQAGIAMALATGSEGQIAQADQLAMRQSGLAHLLSVSGLHISAAIGAAFFLTLRVLALSRTLALRLPVLMIAAGAGAMTAIGYTLLTGAQVPTVRSCVAAVLVLVAMALGREALTLRLVATGAVLVQMVRPEALVGPSFQLSFAAVAAIMALHDSPRVRAWLAKRDERLIWRLARTIAGLLVTGIVVEIALAPIALYHFHKAGLYGALANLVAIPLTTFVIMPAEAAALALDPMGVSAPFWALTGRSIAALLWIAHWVADWPGAVASLPVLPTSAFVAIMLGGLWVILWRHRVRWLGLLPVLISGLCVVMIPPPDLLVSQDGRHLALRDDEDQWALLRPRARDFVRQALAERAGFQGDLVDLDAAKGARCSDAACLATITRGGRVWNLLAIRSAHFLNWSQIIAACQWADIVVAARRLPQDCQPRWLKLDPNFLRRSGGLAIRLAPMQIKTARLAQDDHPWVSPMSLGQ